MPAVRAAGTPADVVITSTAREPERDSTLGVPVDVVRTGTPRHRLVTIGDSLTHGFMSMAVEATDASFPALIARALGWERAFRHPGYEGFGGIPLNLEWLLRGLEDAVGDELGFHEGVAAFLAVRRMLNRHEEFWERGPGSRIQRPPTILHNLAVYGWDLRDALTLDADVYHARLVQPRDDRLLAILPENADAIAGLRVLDSARDGRGRPLNVFEAAAALGEEGTVERGRSDAGPGTEGIETLIVWLGANNALPTVLSLTVSWTEDDFADPAAKSRYSVWRPEHFAAELAEVVAAVRRIRARHVLWSTVPHVTIAPLARGMGGKTASNSRFFNYYTRVWLDEDTFLKDPGRFPHLTGDQARAIDSAIDQYNAAIISHVRAARRAGLDWHVVDIAGVLDRLAHRRYVEHPEAAPAWWSPYEIPQGLLDALGYEPTTLFLRSGRSGVTQGGLVSLDGIHPTGAGYALVAHEMIRVMRDAGVAFFEPDGVTRREDPGVDWAWAVQSDALLSSPLGSLSTNLDVLGWLDSRFGVVARAERAMRFRNPE